jgi:23S rRNA (guanosine2251-2'-O)-methyltransferase
MAGNSERKGAKRKGASKKGATVGSGGQRRQGLEGRGPTPKAAERPGHPAKRRSDAAKRRAARSGESSRSASTPRSRRPADGEYVYGRNSVVEALRADVPVTALYVAERIDTDDRVREALQTAADRKVPMLEAPRAELDRLSGRGVHQGLILQVPSYDYAHPDDLNLPFDDDGTPSLLVALDGVTDPRNLGAIVRSAAAFGARGVVVPERRAAGMTASAWKTSAGAASRVPVARATNLSRALDGFRKSGFMIVGLAADGDADVADLPIADGPLVVVVGSEGKGMSRLVREQCDLVASIPIAADTESLNAGVATGVALYAIARQRPARQT